MDVITLNAHIWKEEKLQVYNLSSYLKNLEKEDQNKSKASGRKNNNKNKHRNQ